jgi:microcin C transport system substrate-binding protein
MPDPAEVALLDPFRKELPARLFEQPFRLPVTDGRGLPGQRNNLRRARELLAAAGWHMSSGHLVNTTGTVFDIEILLGDPAEERVALTYGASLEKLGITVRVRTVESAQFQSRLETFDYDLVSRWWSSTLSPGNEQWIFYSSVAADQPGSRNYAGIRQKAIDTLIQTLLQTESYDDLVLRIRALDRILLWGFYLIPLFHLSEELVAIRPNLRHPPAQPVYGLNLETWWHQEP